MKLEKHERGNRNKPYRRFALTRRGRMSWADWFHLRAHGFSSCCMADYLRVCA